MELKWDQPFVLELNQRLVASKFISETEYSRNVGDLRMEIDIG